MKQLLWTALYQLIDMLQALFKSRLIGLTDHRGEHPSDDEDSTLV